MGQLRRRRFLIASGALVALAASAGVPQARGKSSTKLWRIGFLGPQTRAQSVPYRAAFLDGMRERGYVLGKNFVLIERYADNRYARLPALAKELVRLEVELIFTGTVQATRAAQHATATLPIVFVAVFDPVKAGFANSLARPGRNLTGMSNLAVDLGPKRLELLQELVPKLTRVAILLNPTNPYFTGKVTKRTQAAADRLGLKLEVVKAGTPEGIEPAFATMARERIAAVYVTGDVLFYAQRKRVAAAALQHRIASIFPFRECTEAGGLMSYGTDVDYQMRHAATYVDEILKGAKPGALPIEQPEKFQLVINLKTAKALGLKIPETLLLQAGKVID